MCICSFRFRLRSMIQKSQSRRLAASQIVGNASPGMKSLESSLPRKRALTEKMITAMEKMITAIRLRSMFAERQRSNKKSLDSDWAVIDVGKTSTRMVGGLLGHWAVSTLSAVLLFRLLAEAGDRIDKELLTL